MLTSSNVFTNNTTKVSEAVHLIDLYVTQRRFFVFTYS